MSYSSSDFQQDTFNLLVAAGMIPKQADPEDAAEAADLVRAAIDLMRAQRGDLSDALAVSNAALENVLLHLGKHMTTGDLHGRTKLVKDNTRLLKRLCRFGAAQGPTLREALETIRAQGNDSCTCETRSWYGKDHDSACPFGLARAALRVRR